MKKFLPSAFCLCLFAAAAWADYKDEYRAGIQAADRRQWSEVVRLMELAIAAKPVEGEQVSIYGMRFEPYLPHYHLGVAHFNLGNCEAALRAWGESERQRAVIRTNFYANLKKLRASCPEPKPVPPEPEPEPVPAPVDPALTRVIATSKAEIERAESAAEALARVKREAAAIWSAHPSLRTRESQASQKLTAARTAFTRAQSEGNLSGIQSAGQAAAAMRAEFEAIRKDLLAEQRHQREWQTAASELKKHADEADALVRGGAPSTPQLASAAGDLRKLIGSAREISPQIPVRQLQTMTQQLSAAISSYRKLLGGAVRPTEAPPAVLISAATAYFRGDYSRTVSLLETPRFDSRLASAQAMLFRGAARYALYLIGGEKDAQMRVRALEDLREAARLDKRAVPDSRFFSPRLSQVLQPSR